jgi:hypothetical protein
MLGGSQDHKANVAPFYTLQAEAEALKQMPSEDGGVEKSLSWLEA